jgi:hypothetical protein
MQNGLVYSSPQQQPPKLQPTSAAASSFNLQGFVNLNPRPNDVAGHPPLTLLSNFDLEADQLNSALPEDCPDFEVFTIYSYHSLHATLTPEPEYLKNHRDHQ